MDDNDSRRTEGGLIPGLPGKPAFVLSGPEPSAIPVLIAVPHAGRSYPATLLKRMRHPDSAALRLEDRYADVLAESVAKATGAMLLVANAPRAMIDLNRAPDDVDWDMIQADSGIDVGSYTPGRRARTGLGLIPRRLPGIGELWKRRHEHDELAQRISEVHEPYHECLAATLADLRRRWGTALLIDLHSMPSLARRGSQAPPEFVLGDRFGAACHGRFVASAFAYFEEMQRCAVHNRPYAGGYVLERHAIPKSGLHALQLEIDRSVYLDSRLDEPGKGFACIAELLSGLVSRLAGEVAALGQSEIASSWPEAAE
ncbi:MAG: N-formylglutamate amidohydrolase [Novosphingobium sp.]|nr:N-formylglutamate amidohydrolase [Novosphingobium sp.]